MADDGRIRIGIDIDEESFKSGLAKLGSTASGALGALGKAAGVALGAATAATTAFAKSAVDAGMNFDTSMSQVAATMGKTVDEIQDLRSFAMEMGATTAFSASEAADGLNILAMAGLSANEQMAALPSVMDLAAAGAMSLDASASYVTAAVKGFGDEMDNAQYYADLMAKGATLANTDVAGLGEALSRSAATANKYGQEADSLTLSLLRLAEQNVTGEAASTALNRAMVDLYAPTDSAKKAMDALGFSAYDATAKEKDFNVVIDELNNAVKYMSPQMRNATLATIFTSQGLSAFNKMTVTSTGSMDKFREGLAGAFGSAAQQAGTQLDNLAGDITLFQSALEGAQIVLSDQLTPTLRDFVQFGTDAVQRLSDAFQEGGLEGLTDELGNVLSDAIAMIMEMLPVMLEAGMGLLEAVGQGIQGNLPQITSAALDIVLTLFEALISALPAVVEAGIQMTAQLARGFAEGTPTLMGKATEAIIAIAQSLTDPGNLENIVSAALSIMRSLAQGLAEALPQLAEVLPQIAENIGNFFNEHSADLLRAGAEILGYIVTGILDSFPLLFDALAELVLTFLGAGDEIADGFGEKTQLLSSILQGLAVAFVAVKAAVLGYQAAMAITEIIQKVGSVISWLTNITNLQTAAQAALNAVMNMNPFVLITTLVLGLVGAFVTLIATSEDFRNLVTAAFDAVIQKAKELWDWLGKVSGGLIGGTSGSVSGSVRPTTSAGGATRQRMASAVAASSDNTEGGEGISQTAAPLSSFNRAAAVQALETAMPNIQARIQAANNAMAPAAGYSMPPSFGNAYGGRNSQQAGQTVQPVVNIRFSGDLAQLGRILKPVIDVEDVRIGTGV